MLSSDEISRIMEEAERFKLDDAEVKKRFEAKNSLENYVYDTRATFFTKKSAIEHISCDSKKIEDEIKSAMEWLDEHQNAETHVFVSKKGELMSVWEPIVAKFITF
ncbi:hypothetical protein F511_46699 [Dorcoceras hygrometricum]|uniref:Uncharacterized protein n=1 Tax=Dorcoceras hygrometricum TaxID=472368 RepID=A0A2Z6ZSV7_9LAMI|nr:hypothetical protein F511_46699 [Dorcoceras hygrometricum]